MNSICNKAETCDASLSCDQAQKHDCADLYCVDGCKFDATAKCIPVETVAPIQKPVRVRAFKEDIVRENTLLKMRVHELEILVKSEQEDFDKLIALVQKIRTTPTLQKIVWALKGGAV